MDTIPVGWSADVNVRKVGSMGGMTTGLGPVIRYMTLFFFQIDNDVRPVTCLLGHDIDSRIVLSITIDTLRRLNIKSVKT